jgi:hypothetical protein
MPRAVPDDLPDLPETIPPLAYFIGFFFGLPPFFRIRTFIVFS